MTVVHKPYIIFDIQKIKEAKIEAKKRVLARNPDLDLFRVKIVLKSWIENTKKGYKILEKLKYGDKVDQLTKEYLDTTPGFTAFIPMTAKTIEWNKYKVGSEIIMAYYPSNVWASFHTDGEPDNINDKKRIDEG